MTDPGRYGAPVFLGAGATAAGGDGAPSYPSGYLDLTSSNTGSASGLVASLPVTPPTEVWILDRVVISCTSTGATTARLHDGPTNDLSTVLDDSADASLDVAEYPQRLTIQPGRTLSAIWLGTLSPGSTVTLRAIGRRYVTGGVIP